MKLRKLNFIRFGTDSKWITVRVSDGSINPVSYGHVFYYDPTNKMNNDASNQHLLKYIFVFCTHDNKFFNSAVGSHFKNIKENMKMILENL